MRLACVRHAASVDPEPGSNSRPICVASESRARHHPARHAGRDDGGRSCVGRSLCCPEPASSLVPSTLQLVRCPALSTRQRPRCQAGRPPRRPGRHETPVLHTCRTGRSRAGLPGRWPGPAPCSGGALLAYALPVGLSTPDCCPPPALGVTGSCKTEAALGRICTGVQRIWSRFGDVYKNPSHPPALRWPPSREWAPPHFRGALVS